MVDPARVRGDEGRAHAAHDVAVERDRAERGGDGSRQRREHREACEHRPEADRDGEAGEHAGGDRHDQRAVADPDRLLEAEDREQERRVLFRVADRVARERHAGGERDQAQSSQRDQTGSGAATPEPCPEGREDEREQHHQVALLESVGAVRRVERRLGEDRQEDAEPERCKGALLARARAPEGDGQAGERARDEREARRVGEQQRVGPEPVPERNGSDPE